MKKKMLNSRTTFANNYKRQVSSKYNSNKSIYLPPTTSSRRSIQKYLVSSSLDHKTNAILERRDNSLICHKQKHIVVAQQLQFLMSNRQLGIIKSMPFKSTNTSAKQPVNPYSNSLIDDHPDNMQDTRKSVSQTSKMNHIYYIVALLMAICALLQSTTFVMADSALLEQANRLKISPDIVPISSYVKVIKVELHGKIVKPGDIVPAKNFKDLNMAKITWDADDTEVRHTLMLLDLDRRPSNSNSSTIYNQFTSLNIPGNIINAGQTIVAFDTPVVPCQPNTKHRMLMLAFSQDQNIDISDVFYMSAPSGHSTKRENFKLKDFIKLHRLEIAAANVFQALGEASGPCSGSITLRSMNNLLSILTAMVIAITAYGFSGRKLLVD